jgi:DNA-binding transcriptional regulator YhcF (GntR family)
MLPQKEVQEYLRRRIIADLHLGRLKPGDRAPSLRTVAHDLGVGIRAVSRAYSKLAEEGLVVIRGRSGVYAAPTPSCDPPMTEPHSWYSTVLTDAWTRRIPLPMLPQLLQRYVSRRLRAACIESTDDHMIAFCAELDEDFGLDTVAIKVQHNPETNELGADDLRRIEEALSTTDFVVTTAFHASAVRVIAQRSSKPVVVVSVNEAIVHAVQTKIAERGVVMLVADEAFARRVDRYLVEAFAPHGRLQVMHIRDFMADPTRVDGAEPMATRAARRMVSEPDFHLVDEPIPFLSLTAARELTQCMIAVQEQPA